MVLQKIISQTRLHRERSYCLDSPPLSCSSLEETEALSSSKDVEEGEIRFVNIPCLDGMVRLGPGDFAIDEDKCSSFDGGELDENVTLRGMRSRGFDRRCFFRMFRTFSDTSDGIRIRIGRTARHLKRYRRFNESETNHWKYKFGSDTSQRVKERTGCLDWSLINPKRNVKTFKNYHKRKKEKKIR